MKYNLSNNEHLEINGDIYVKGIGEYDGTNAGGNEVKTLKDILNSGVTEITWSGLVTLRTNSKLIPGQQYRITDYTCTTVQDGTRSAGHVFDIIVMADSGNKLNEEAHAIQHTGDDYFASSNLCAWRLWYCLDNHTNRFAWADKTNGKGVIYRMIDEFYNDVPYDFKNIQFYRQWDESKSLWSTISSNTTGVPCYTFSSQGNSSTLEFTDFSLSISNGVYSNVIKEYKDIINFDFNNIKFILNNNCFFGKECYNNTFGNKCYKNTFGNKCYENTFGNSCYENTFGGFCYHNTFGDTYHFNTFGNYCILNTFGNSCSYNTFGGFCKSNTFGGFCQYNTFGTNCSYNTFGNWYQYNTFGSSIEESQFGDGVQYFSITNAQMTTEPTSANAKSYIRWLIVENGVSYVNAYVTGSTSSSSYCQNIRICQGCSGTSSAYKSFQIDNINMASQLIVCYDTSGTLRTGNIGNLLAKLS